MNAYVSENYIVVGQQRLKDKENEITAIPQLLDKLDTSIYWHADTGRLETSCAGIWMSPSLRMLAELEKDMRQLTSLR